MATTTLTGGCHCRAVRYTLQPTTSSLPLAACYCYCRDCRLTSGFYCVLWAGIQRSWLHLDPSSAAGMKSYRSSSSANRSFCGSCGTTLLFESSVHGMALSASTLDRPVAQDGITRAVKPRAHIYLGSTYEGGLGSLIEDRAARFQRTSDGSTRPSTPEANDDVIADKDNSDVAESRVKILRGRCHCGGVRFSVSRKAATDEETQLASKWITSEGKFGAMHCVCDDCRLAAGTPFITWLFIPPSLITFITSSTLVTRTSSPPPKDVLRHFCGTCGCTLFYNLHDRGPGRDVWDVSAAVFDGEHMQQEMEEKWTLWRPSTMVEGAGEEAEEMLEGYLGEWYKNARGTISFEEEGRKYNPELVEALKRGRSQCGRF